MSVDVTMCADILDELAALLDDELAAARRLATLMSAADVEGLEELARQRSVRQRRIAAMQNSLSPVIDKAGTTPRVRALADKARELRGLDESHAALARQGLRVVKGWLEVLLPAPQTYGRDGRKAGPVSTATFSRRV